MALCEQWKYVGGHMSRRQEEANGVAQCHAGGATQDGGCAIQEITCLAATEIDVLNEGRTHMSTGSGNCELHGPEARLLHA